MNTDNPGNSYDLLISFNGIGIFYYKPGASEYTQIAYLAQTPNTNYPFTFSVILVENSASNVTVSTVYINSTLFTNCSTPP